jgi:hypothetical protein
MAPSSQGRILASLTNSLNNVLEQTLQLIIGSGKYIFYNIDTAIFILAFSRTIQSPMGRIPQNILQQ